MPLNMPIDGWGRIGVVPLPVDGIISTQDASFDPSRAIVLGFAREIFTPHFSEIRYNVSKVWLEAEYPNENIDSLKEIKLHVFEPNVFIETGCTRVPKLKIKGFSTTVEIKRTGELRRAKMSNLVQLVLYQINSDKHWWFAATPEVVSRLSKKKTS